MGKNMFLVGVGVVAGMVLHHYVIEKNGTHNAFDRAVDQGEAKLKATAQQLQTGGDPVGDVNAKVQAVADKVTEKTDAAAAKVAATADKTASKVTQVTNKAAAKGDEAAAKARELADE